MMMLQRLRGFVTLAKKSKIPTKTIGIIVGVVIIGTLIAVFVFGDPQVWFVQIWLILGLPIALQELPADAELMLPIDEINEHNKIIDDKILNEFGECDEEMFALEPEICAEDKKMIEEEEDKKIIIEPPTNMTKHSEDDPITQVCDQLEIDCGTEIMELNAKITKIDSQGNSTELTNTFQIPALSFLADPTDFDFKDGVLELRLGINTKRNIMIESAGTFDVFVNNETINNEPIKIRANGITDNDGLIDIEFVSPTGFGSPLYTFNFGQNFDKFINEQINPLELRILKLDVTRIEDIPIHKDFSILDQEIITLDIERDDIKIIIQDEEFGTFSRVYPTDSRIVIGSFPKTLVAISGACIGKGATTAPAPQIGRVEVFDSNGELVTFSNGGTGLRFMDELLTRNANYTVTMFFPTDQGIIEYGKSQETKTFECHSELKSNTCTTHCVRQVKAGGQSWTHCQDIVGSFVIDPIPVCNLP